MLEYRIVYNHALNKFLSYSLREFKWVDTIKEAFDGNYKLYVVDICRPMDDDNSFDYTLMNSISRYTEQEVRSVFSDTADSSHWVKIEVVEWMDGTSNDIVSVDYSSVVPMMVSW